MTYNKSEIMRRAWEIKRADSENIFAECLRMAWAEAKASADYTISCEDYYYITLEQNGNFIIRLDNCKYCAEEMIYTVEERTGMNFKDIPIKGKKSDFCGLRFFKGGWRRDFWSDFPSKEEIDNYMNNRARHIGPSGRRGEWSVRYMI